MKRNLSIKNMLSTAFVALVLLSVSSLTAFSQVATQTPVSTPEIVKQAFPSVVALVMKNAKDDSTQTGSGFFIGPDTIVTNFHIIDGANRGYAKIIGQTQQFRVIGTYGLDEANDLALVKIESSIGIALVLAGDDLGSVGDEVFAVGNPQGLEGTFSQGIIRGSRKSNNIDLLQITAAISQGSSGGPVLNNRGEVLGVAVRYLKDGDLNFAIPVRHLRELIAKKQGGISFASPSPSASPSQSTSSSPSTPSPSSVDAFALAARSVTEFDVNGLKVIVKRRASSPTIAGGLFIRGGARNINEKNAGIESLMLSTAIDAGKTLPRQTVRRELASMGSAFGASVTNDFSVVSFGSTRQNFDRAWEIYSEVLLNPAFAEDDIK
ncbi:MAG: trypsin-like peptidase domain-containing protein, partial [Pyrinomonadaceae bacterium]